MSVTPTEGAPGNALPQKKEPCLLGRAFDAAASEILKAVVFGGICYSAKKTWGAAVWTTRKIRGDQNLSDEEIVRAISRADCGNLKLNSREREKVSQFLSRMRVEEPGNYLFYQKQCRRCFEIDGKCN